jgi:hypothetical protein
MTSGPPGTAATVPLPAGVSEVAVSEGSVSSGIDAHLTTGSSISGTVKSTTGALLGGEVRAYLNGTLVATGIATAGHYQIDGLDAGSYAVCMPATSTGGGPGYRGRCWKNAAFDGAVPSGAALVSLGSGEQRTGIDLTLPLAAAISGTVRSPGGTGLDNVDVTVHNLTTGTNSGDLSRAGGVYVVKRLGPSAKGYRVCFRPPHSLAGTGYLPACYRNVAWNGASYPTTVTPVSVTVGHTHTGVNQTLQPGGAISGTVRDFSTGGPVSRAPVTVYSARGRLLGYAATSPGGYYKVRDLAATAGDRVCVGPFQRSRTLAYHGRCWKNVVWNGGRLPSGTAPVRVRNSATHGGIDLRLHRVTGQTAAISGTVTQASDGTPLSGASVTLFRHGTDVANKSSDASGHYSFPGLGAATGYSVCVLPMHVDAPLPPATGWSPQCYADVPWDGLAVPAAAQLVSVAAGQVVTGIDIAVHPGGEIDGTVVKAGGSTPVPDVVVDVFTTTGHQVTATMSGADGTYTVGSLPPKNYVVCFEGRSTLGPVVYVSQCYDNVSWVGPNNIS